MTTVALIGGGKLARAALSLLRAGGADVVASARDHAQRQTLKDGGATLATSTEAVRSASIVFLCVPATAFADVVDSVAGAARGDQIVLHASRGVGPGCALPHEMIRRGSCWKKIAALGGPLYVDTIPEAGAAGRRLSAAIASRFDEAVRAVRLLTEKTVRLSATRDVPGVEIAGALSNVGHLAAGLASGAGFGETEQGLLTVRALLEGARLGSTLGADQATFTGLAGIGDLIPRNVTSTRHHRQAGERHAASGPTASEFTGESKHLEGLVTAREVAERARETSLDLPLVCAVDDVFAGRVATRAALERVLALDLGLQAA